MSWSITKGGPARVVAVDFKKAADEADTYLRSNGWSEEAALLHRVVAIVDVACSTCPEPAHMFVEASGHGFEGLQTLTFTMHPIAAPKPEPVEVQEPATDPQPVAEEGGDPQKVEEVQEGEPEADIKPAKKKSPKNS